ncbi:MAG: YfiM family protein [Hymenobacteraceae bacterium]|nr:YfiM family protein [Hymenobacteraceae bacterium]
MQGIAQAPDTVTAPVNKQRLLLLGTGFTVGYTAMLVSLNNTWYKDQERTRFHFFNDNSQWKQMDKAGHFWGAFHQSRAGIDLLRWAGLPDKKAIWYGGLVGIALQTPIEIFDGYQSDYGASVGDLVANTVGSAGIIAQELAWREVRIMPKYSFQTTRYAAERPNVLGSNLAEQALKDYNGQTYWLSVNVGSFLKAESKYPKWLSIAVGYGADGMVYNDPELNSARGFNAHRQYYLSPDLNLMHFKGRSKVLNTTLYILSIIKIPAPALEYNRIDGLRFHPLYF